ncbi:MAG TPA: hypothetical protein VNA22_01785 [Pyrinomonadaceae bacterium]|nr:hypothetical protein [Pyrinomonadaceae bacterium]
MKISSRREVVVEIERLTLVRKRAKTTIGRCADCAKQTDFLPLVKAAELFGISPAELLEFTRANDCHFTVGAEGEICLCLVDLLSAMSKRITKGTIKLIGGPSM